MICMDHEARQLSRGAQLRALEQFLGDDADDDHDIWIVEKNERPDWASRAAPDKAAAAD